MLQKATKGYKRLQKATRGYKRLQEATRGYEAAMEPLALRMRTRDETGSGRGNLTKFAFSKFLKFFQNFLKFPEKFLLFLAQNIFQTEFFMAASVRARSGRPKNMLISGFRCMWLSSRRGSGRLWILANRLQPPATARRPSTSCRRFEIWRSIFPI